MNDSFEEVTGISSDLVFEQGLEQMVHPEDVSIIRNGLTAALDGKTVSELVRYAVPNTDEYQSIYQSFAPVKEEGHSKITTIKSVGKLELKEI